MILKVVIDDRLLELNVPEAFIAKAQDFFAKMDADMDRGWQVNREWVEAPDRLLRAQIAADKLLTALENENDNLGRLMAGYIVSRVPEIASLELNPAGETRDHVIRVTERTAPRPGSPRETPLEAPRADTATDRGVAPSGLDKMSALAQAAKDVSKVFKAGRHYRYSVFNHATGGWEESPAIADKAQAEALREQAFKARFEALCR